MLPRGFLPYKGSLVGINRLSHYMLLMLFLQAVSLSALLAFHLTLYEASITYLNLFPHSAATKQSTREVQGNPHNPRNMQTDLLPFFASLLVK
jgi:hypothetical protein